LIKSTLIDNATSVTTKLKHMAPVHRTRKCWLATASLLAARQRRLAAFVFAARIANSSFIFVYSVNNKENVICSTRSEKHNLY